MFMVAKSSIPTLSYFQVGGMKHDQELYAKGALFGPVGTHRAPIGALYRSAMQSELFAALQECFSFNLY